MLEQVAEYHVSVNSCAYQGRGMASVEGYVELAKLLVSVVIPVMRASAARSGRADASDPICGMAMRIWNSSSDAEDISMSESIS